MHDYVATKAPHDTWYIRNNYDVSQILALPEDEVIFLGMHEDFNSAAQELRNKLDIPEGFTCSVYYPATQKVTRFPDKPFHLFTDVDTMRKLAAKNGKIIVHDPHSHLHSKIASKHINKGFALQLFVYEDMVLEPGAFAINANNYEVEFNPSRAKRIQAARTRKTRPKTNKRVLACSHGKIWDFISDLHYSCDALIYNKCRVKMQVDGMRYLIGESKLEAYGHRIQQVLTTARTVKVNPFKKYTPCLSWAQLEDYIPTMLEKQKLPLNLIESIIKAGYWIANSPGNYKKARRAVNKQFQVSVDPAGLTRRLNQWRRTLKGIQNEQKSAATQKKRRTRSS